MDILGPLPETKIWNKHNITATDTCTHYLFGEALKRTRMKETVEFLIEKEIPRLYKRITERTSSQLNSKIL